MFCVTGTSNSVLLMFSSPASCSLGDVKFMQKYQLIIIIAKGDCNCQQIIVYFIFIYSVI